MLRRVCPQCSSRKIAHKSPLNFLSKGLSPMIRRVPKVRCLVASGWRLATVPVSVTILAAAARETPRPTLCRCNGRDTRQGFARVATQGLMGAVRTSLLGVHLTRASVPALSVLWKQLQNLLLGALEEKRTLQDVSEPPSPRNFP